MKSKTNYDSSNAKEIKNNERMQKLFRSVINKYFIANINIKIVLHKSLESTIGILKEQKNIEAIIFIINENCANKIQELIQDFYKICGLQDFELKFLFLDCTDDKLIKYIKEIVENKIRSLKKKMM